MSMLSDFLWAILKRYLPKREPLSDQPGAGITDAFNRFYSRNGELDAIRKREDEIMAAIKACSARTTTLRFLMNHKLSGYGQVFHPYKRFNSAESGFNQVYFDSVRSFCRRANKLGCNVQIEVWDMNYARLGASCALHGRAAFCGLAKQDQKDLMLKLVETVKDLAVSFVVTNEEDFAWKIPDVTWNANAVRYLKSITDHPVGTWQKLACAEADFRVFHGKAWNDFAAGSVCNEEGYSLPGVAGTSWGGGGHRADGVYVPVTLANCKTYLGQMHEKNVIPIQNVWDDFGTGKFAVNAAEALKWAHEQGWWL